MAGQGSGALEKSPALVECEQYIGLAVGDEVAAFIDDRLHLKTIGRATAFKRREGGRLN